MTGLLAGVAGLSEQLTAAGQGESNNRIGEVSFYPFSMKAKDPIRIALGTVVAEEVLVRVCTRGGTVGWGEASPYAAVTGDTQASSLAAGKSLVEVVIGCEPFEIPRIVAGEDQSGTISEGRSGIRRPRSSWSRIPD